MKIHLHEITSMDTELDFTEAEGWPLEAVELIDELPSTEPTPLRPTQTPKAKPRPVQAHFSLRKVDEVVVVNGSIDTYVRLVCSRCANPFQMTMRPNFSSLFCKDPVMAGVAHLEQPGKPAGQNKGFARHAHDASQDALIAEGRDLDITYLCEDTIDLKELLMEQLQLQVPFQPLCDQECKGMCANCGADLNVGRCACAKVAKVTPFSVLKNLKL
jgi:uncharacterized protein